MSVPNLIECVPCSVTAVYERNREQRGQLSPVPPRGRRLGPWIHRSRVGFLEPRFSCSLKSLGRCRVLPPAGRSFPRGVRLRAGKAPEPASRALSSFRAEGPRKNNFSPGISSSPHLRSLLGREILSVALLRLRFRSVVALESGTNLSAILCSYSLADPKRAASHDPLPVLPDGKPSSLAWPPASCARRG